MKTFKGTPGNYFIHKTNTGTYVKSNSGQQYTLEMPVVCVPQGETAEERDANAQLLCSSKQMMEALQELLRFENCMRYYGAPNLQYPDNFLKAIENAKATLSAALD